MTDIFPIVPASARTFWVLAPICALLGVLVVALAYTAYSSRHSRIEISGAELRVVGDFWGRRIPIEALTLDRAVVIDLAEAREYAPRIRTFGTGLPGYASGRHKLRNGDRALVYLTRRAPVLYIPRTQGYSLLLSAERPDELLAGLEGRAGP